MHPAPTRQPDEIARSLQHAARGTSQVGGNIGAVKPATRPVRPARRSSPQHARCPARARNSTPGMQQFLATMRAASKEPAPE